ncbi:class I SAM-dependent methyltransferase [Mucilaginibacter sp. BJC16-A38]|uniref:class I SAM-dependent methyltransferase n=1 Tax=Mucilaginibacter phenanthrenivorans TaxID=1234842 RepID=UPI002157F771|nr:class I SAM-dependent methyltransferase [Mucilaginibacter phenanthrenivorans]MCR8558366.1 class I SAM-dependent methyltransferase [Mucilaginibacter phenanthrenivorans]
MQQNLQQLYGNIDIYLFDQLLKGRFDNCHKILDAGCGGGRNLIYFLRNGFDVYGIDPNPQAVEAVKALATALAPNLSLTNFKTAAAEDLPFNDEAFDLVISSAVLHFANNEDHFEAMLTSMWKVLKPGGYLFARLASDIGIEDKVKHIENRRYLLPDGSVRFLVNEQMLLNYTQNLKGQLFEPIKTTNVQNLRCMTTWCLQKV